MARTLVSAAEIVDSFVTTVRSPLPESALVVAKASTSYRELTDSRSDCVVEYHALRHGYNIVSRINYSLLRRIRRRRTGAEALRTA